MKRRSFLKTMSAVPVMGLVPLPRVEQAPKLCGSFGLATHIEEGARRKAMAQAVIKTREELEERVVNQFNIARKAFYGIM